MMVRVLILEDDDDIRLISSETLREAGFEVLGASSVERAIEMCRSDAPELALVDLQLEGRSGWEFVRWARSEGQHTRCAVFSVHAMEPHNVEEGVRLEVGALIQKTGNPEDLVRAVRDLLSAS